MIQDDRGVSGFQRFIPTRPREMSVTIYVEALVHTPRNPETPLGCHLKGILAWFEQTLGWIGPEVRNMKAAAAGRCLRQSPVKLPGLTAAGTDFAIHHMCVLRWRAERPHPQASSWEDELRTRATEGPNGSRTLRPK